MPFRRTVKRATGRQLLVKHEFSYHPTMWPEKQAGRLLKACVMLSSLFVVCVVLLWKNEAGKGMAGRKEEKP